MAVTGSPGTLSSSAEEYALTKVWKDICGTFSINIEHPSLITNGVISHTEKAAIFGNNQTQSDRVSALLDIILGEIQAKNYQRFEGFLYVLRSTAASQFLWRRLQKHLEEYQQQLQAPLRKSVQ